MDRRNKLSTESVEAVECLRSWLGANIVKGITECLNEENSESVIGHEDEVAEAPL
jgi:hypothetical protein